MSFSRSATSSRGIVWGPVLDRGKRAAHDRHQHRKVIGDPMIGLEGQVGWDGRTEAWAVSGFAASSGFPFRILQ